MKVLVGLGNPTERYRKTPHNAGFAVVDELARRLSCAMRSSFRFNARVGEVAFGGDRLLLAKPETYMNRSGSSVAGILAAKQVAPADLIVALDDADLDFGRIRVKPGGGSAGHKGLASIIESVGSDKFARVRVGIGRSGKNEELAEQVLAQFSKKEQEVMSEAIERAADAALCVVERGVDVAMNRFNTRNVEQTENLNNKREGDIEKL